MVSVQSVQSDEDAHSVADALQSLELDVELVRTWLKKSYFKTLEASDNSPKGARGQIAYLELIKVMRDDLVPRGWCKPNPGNVELTVSPDRTFAISISSGDVNTGKSLDIVPSTRNSKGSQTQKVLDCNAMNHSLDFGDVEENLVSDSRKSVGFSYPIWCLLYYYDHRNGALYSELSLPVAMDAKGHVCEWKRRIILPPVDLKIIDGQTTGDMKVDLGDESDGFSEQIKFDAAKKQNDDREKPEPKSSQAS